MGFDHRKYKSFPLMGLSDRIWPDRRIEKAPQWCSVDLRDGNQALIEPMSTQEKHRLFDMLVDIGFTQIEVGFPAASRPDFAFVRELIKEDRIPDQVTIQVLTQARPDIIQRTFESLRGVRRAILHVYNPTSRLHRERVFRLDRASIRQIALDAAAQIASLAAAAPETDWTFQYSPEGFTTTEPEFVAEVCDGVSAVWQPSPERPMIVTLPATVESATPNVYADQVEWLCRTIKRRDSIVISTHTHNDRGCAVAAAELAVMAGAQRVEGTLLGNGERCGNMDILVMAMNLYSQGIDPQLDFSAMERIVATVTRCTRIDLHPRHPYCGDLVFTAFSGGHQDAIRKCLETQADGLPWEVTYLPVDPRDLGRSYQDIIRINSQSGKGGVTYVLETRLGVSPPRWLQIDFAQRVQIASEASGGEIDVETIWDLFVARYLHPRGAARVARLEWQDAAHSRFKAWVHHGERTLCIPGTAHAPEMLAEDIAACLGLPCTSLDTKIQPLAAGATEKGQVIAYVRLVGPEGRLHGVAIGAGRIEALLRAILQALGPALPPDVGEPDDISAPIFAPGVASVTPSLLVENGYAE